MIYYYRYLFVKMKVFNYSELHFSELTSFNIHTLNLVLAILWYTYEDHCANLKRPEINPVIVSWIRRLSVVALAK